MKHFPSITLLAFTLSSLLSLPMVASFRST